MNRAIFPVIAAVYALSQMTACGWLGQKKQAADGRCDSEVAVISTMEDTVRLQLGGKLYYRADVCPFSPADSITVIGSRYFSSDDYERNYPPETEGLYREYRFIVHNRNSCSHRLFEEATLDSVYKSYMEDTNYMQWYDSCLRPKLDFLRAEYIDPAIGNFNGYWVYLSEYEGDYYLDNQWDWLSSFCIADSIITRHTMDGPDPNKVRKAVVSDGGLSVVYFYKNESGEYVEDRIVPVDRKREIYRYNGYSYIIPTRAIHNFQMIEYANNTGDLI